LMAFEHCFGISLQAMFPSAVQFVLDNGLMHYTDISGSLPGHSRLQLTHLGKKHFGGCVALFYSPAVQHYLMSQEGGEIFSEDPLQAIMPLVSTVELPPQLDASISQKPALHQHVQAQTVPITFVGGGETVQIDAQVGLSLYDVARNHRIPLEAACRGECACSTCHVKLPLDPQCTQSVSEEEQDMIELATGNDKTSRLACQLVVDDSLRGAVIAVPDDVLMGKGLHSSVKAGAVASSVPANLVDQTTATVSSETY